jgi:hypothetical protein
VKLATPTKGGKNMARKWTEAERKAFGEKMKAARAKKGVKQPKPEVEIPKEVKELSGISEPDNVNVFIKNPVSINGVSFSGMCNVPADQAGDLQYRSDMVDWRKKKELDSTNHVIE